LKKYIVIFFALIILIFIIACTKTVGYKPDSFYSDRALADSCINGAPYYYLNNSNTIFPGNNGPHGAFKLRLNSIALNALTENGKLPTSASMPNGSLIVKDIYKGNNISLYALMYKRENSWLWAEYDTKRKVVYSVNKNPGLCINCHNQSGNRDLVVTFKHY